MSSTAYLTSLSKRDFKLLSIWMAACIAARPCSGSSVGGRPISYSIRSMNAEMKRLRSSYSASTSPNRSTIFLLYTVIKNNEMLTHLNMRGIKTTLEIVVYDSQCLLETI